MPSAQVQMLQTWPRETAHILVVDDNEDLLLTTRALLVRPGVEVLLGHSAAEALELLGKFDVALALLDVNMPVTDGFTLAETMRDNERTREVPIIFLTGAFTDAERTFRGYEAGAVDFLTKPVHPRVLESKVNAFVALYLQRKSLRDEKASLERLLIENRKIASELARAHKQALHASLTDELTGVSNRRHILQVAEERLTDPRRQSHPLTVAVLDIDHFKQVNDTHGHTVGDAVLRHFCEHTVMHLRAGQVLGRLGGEEFLLLMPGTRADEARTALDRVRQTLGPHDGVRFTFSAGLAQAREGETVAGLLERADQALYRAKHLGRDRVEVSEG